MPNEKTQKVADFLRPVLQEILSLEQTDRPTHVDTKQHPGKDGKLKTWLIQAKVAKEGLSSYTKFTYKKIGQKDVFIASIYINTSLFDSALVTKIRRKKETAHELAHVGTYIQRSVDLPLDLFCEIAIERRTPIVRMAEDPEIEKVKQGLGLSPYVDDVISPHGHFILAIDAGEENELNCHELCAELLLPYQLAYNWMSDVILQYPEAKNVFTLAYRHTIKKLEEEEMLSPKFVKERMELFERNLFVFFSAGLM